jgi:hypothetical protein
VIAQRRLDEEVRGGARDRVQRRRVVAELRERQREALGIAGDLRRRRVCQVFPSGASTIATIPMITPNGPRSLLRLLDPPQIVIRISMSATSAITPTSTAARLIRRTSRLRMCAISCAITPSSSRCESFATRPVVAAT